MRNILNLKKIEADAPEYCYNTNGLCDDERCYCLDEEIKIAYDKTLSKRLENIGWICLILAGTYFAGRILLGIVFKI